MSTPTAMPGPQTARTAGTPGAATPLEDCAMHVTAEIGHPLSLGALHEALLPGAAGDGPDADGALGLTAGLRAVIAAAQRAGLRTAFGRRNLTDLGPALLPAILPTRDGAAVAILTRENNQFTIFDPQAGGETTRVTPDALAPRLTGHALVLKPALHVKATPDAPLRQNAGHWFWSAIRANRWAYTQVALAAVTVNILALVTSLFTMVVYDRILPSAATDSLLALSIGVGIALIFTLLINTLRSGFIDHAGRRADLAMGQKIFDHVTEIQMQARRGSTGATAATLREFETLRDFFTSATLVALVDLPFALLFIGVIFILAEPLAIVPALALPVVVLIGLGVQPALSRLARQILSEGRHKQSVLIETLTGIEAIKAAGATRQMRQRWSDALQRQADYNVRSRAVTQFAINATGFVQQAAQVLIVVFGALQVVAGNITSGVLIAAVILTGRALAPLSLIAQTLSRIHQARASYRSLDDLMQAPGEHPADRRWLSRRHLSGSLRFEDVHFAYPDQRGKALDGVSFDIAPGEKVAFVGPVGSGKSTVVRLILGLYQPDQGAVLADGVDIRQIDPSDLRRNIGAVLQEGWLVSGTLRENIAFGATRPGDDAILQAARLAGVEDFAARHPEGYDMMLREGGGGLSGGQRQMVTLARAFLGHPPMLVLDEATSAMDVQSEMALVSRLKQAPPGQTLILATHRPGLLDLVDRVIVIDGGKIVADGPRSLLNQAQSAPAKGNAA
ncbi:MAG: type I secretion system permease/ATPase [Qingshengfaniella sp.]